MVAEGELVVAPKISADTDRQPWCAGKRYSPNPWRAATITMPGPCCDWERKLWGNRQMGRTERSVF